MTSPVDVYHQASHEFLLKNYSKALESLEKALKLNEETYPKTERPSWQTLLDSQATDRTSPSQIISKEDNYEELCTQEDIKRKIIVLQNTIIATLYVTDINALSNASSSRFAYMGKLANSELVALELWRLCTNAYHFETVNTDPQDIIIIPSRTRSLPPNVVVSLALSAHKLHRYKVAKDICEAWLNSIDVTIEDVIFQASQNLEEASTAANDEQQEQGARNGDEKDADNDDNKEEDSNTADLSLSTSSILNGSNIKFTTAQERFVNSIVTSYERLVEVYVLCVLVKLNEWEQAHQVAIASSQLNGGLMRPSRTDALIDQLNNEKDFAAQKLDRKKQKAEELKQQQKQQKKAQKQQQQQQQQQKQQQSSSTPMSSTNPSKSQDANNSTGFAADRGIISDSLRPRSPTMSSDNHQSSSSSSSSPPSSSSSSSPSSQSRNDQTRGISRLTSNILGTIKQLLQYNHEHLLGSSVLIIIVMLFILRWLRRRNPTSSISIYQSLMVVFRKLFETFQMVSKLS